MDNFIPDVNDIIRQSNHKNINNIYRTNNCQSCGSTKLTMNGYITICYDCQVIDKHSVDSHTYDIMSQRNDPKNNLFINSKTRTYIHVNRKIAHSSYIQNLHSWESVPYNETTNKLLYKKMLSLCKKNKNKKIYNENVIARAIKIFDVIKKYKSNRNPIKQGVLAMCFYYSWKENYIFFTFKQMSKIFKIDKKIISKGNNIINKLYKTVPHIAKVINKTPLNLLNYIDNIQFHFPILSPSHIQNITKYINRIKNNPIAIINVPKSIMVGILCNYVDKYHIQLSHNTIIKKIGASKSNASQYRRKLKPILY